MVGVRAGLGTCGAQLGTFFARSWQKAIKMCPKKVHVRSSWYAQRQVFSLRYRRNFASRTGWHTVHEFAAKNPLYIFAPETICIHSSHSFWVSNTKGHIVFQYHLLWQNEQKVGWIARVGWTTREGLTARVSWVGWILSFVQPEQHASQTTGLL